LAVCFGLIFSQVSEEYHNPSDLYWQTLSHNVVSSTPQVCPSFLFFLYSSLFDWLPLMVFHCCILLYCYIFINFRGQSRTVNNINIRTHYHTVVNLWWNDLCLEWIFELVRTFLYFFRRWEYIWKGFIIGAKKICNGLKVSSPPVFIGVRVTRSLCVIFCRSLFVLFFFDHCVVCPST
jgi:hypothetical protein